MTKASLFGSLFAVLSLAACAAETSGPESTGSESSDGAELGQVQQGLCPRGVYCPPPRYSGYGLVGGFVGSGTFVSDPPPSPAPTFSCPSRVEYPCGPVLAQDAAGNWYCKASCGGGGFGLARYNPCPSWAPNYSCTPYGVCQCY